MELKDYMVERIPSENYIELHSTDPDPEVALDDPMLNLMKGLNIDPKQVRYNLERRQFEKDESHVQ